MNQGGWLRGGPGSPNFWHNNRCVSNKRTIKACARWAWWCPDRPPCLARHTWWCPCFSGITCRGWGPLKGVAPSLITPLLMVVKQPNGSYKDNNAKYSHVVSTFFCCKIVFLTGHLNAYSKRSLKFALQTNQWFFTYLTPLIIDCLRSPWLTIPWEV